MGSRLHHRLLTSQGRIIKKIFRRLRQQRHHGCVIVIRAHLLSAPAVDHHSPFKLALSMSLVRIRLPPPVTWLSLSCEYYHDFFLGRPSTHHATPIVLGTGIFTVRLFLTHENEKHGGQCLRIPWRESQKLTHLPKFNINVI